MRAETEVDGRTPVLVDAFAARDWLGQIIHVIVSSATPTGDLTESA